MDSAEHPGGSKAHQVDGRVDDPNPVTGRSRYTDDISAEGAAPLVFVRSSIAHAELGRVDTARAQTMPGVVAVMAADRSTARDRGVTAPARSIADVRGFPELPATFDRPPLARGRVRFVGDIVAAVVAETYHQAVDAAESVRVDYRPLSPVVDVEVAAASSAPVVWPGHGSNVCFETSCASSDDPLVGADVVVTERVVSQRLAAVPVEPNAALAVPSENDTLTLYLPTQNPHAVRDEIASLMGLERSQLRVVAPCVGGAFGPKADVQVEHLVAAVAARWLGRPVRWMESRSENLVAMRHGRAMVMTASLGLRRDGTILGLDADVLADAGAYPGIGAVQPVETQLMSQGVYDLGCLRFRARSVVTNTTPTGPYRGVGRAEPVQMLERLVDRAAGELGIDPVELRRKNFISSERFPFTTLTGATYDSGQYERALDLAVAEVDYGGVRAEQARRRSADSDRLLGVGVAAYVYNAAGLGAHREYGSVEVCRDGTVEVTAGTTSQGQGHEAAWSSLVAGESGNVQGNRNRCNHGGGGSLW